MHMPWAVLAPGPQIGPKLGVAWGPNFEILGPPQYFENGKSYDLQIWHAHRPWAVLAPGPQIDP